MKKLVCIFMLSLLLVMATMPAMAGSDPMDRQRQINAMPDNLSPEEIEEIDKEADAKYERLLKKLEQREKRQPQNGEVGIQWYYEEETDLGVPKTQTTRRQLVRVGLSPLRNRL